MSNGFASSRRGRPARRPVGKGDIAKAIYGTVTVLAVLLTLEEHPPQAWQAALTVFGTTLALALAHAYSDTIAEVVTRREKLDRRETKEIWRDAAPIMISANYPTIILLISATGLYSVSTALNVAEVILYIALFGYGVVVGRMLHGTLTRILLNGCSTLALGLIISFIKYVFH